MGGVFSSVTWLSFAAVGIGAALGAWLRWLLALAFNQTVPNLPVGTLIANLGGGFLIGMAVGYISKHPEWPIEWRLFCITGFLGGLTTFSTFSAESMRLLQQGDFGWALAHSVVHLVGSVAFCGLGYAVIRGAG